MPTEDLQRLCLKRQGFSDAVIDVMLRARRASSNALYKTYLDKFCDFCCTHNINPLTCSVPKALEFLSVLFDDSTHRGSSALGTARSALSSVIILPDNAKFGDDLYVKMFMKGVKAIRPSEPRYLESWDPDTVLDMFKNSLDKVGARKAKSQVCFRLEVWQMCFKALINVALIHDHCFYLVRLIIIIIIQQYISFK